MKNVLRFFLAAAILVLTSSQVKAPQQQQQRRFTVILNASTWQAVYNVLDQSQATHLLVKQVQDSILSQINDTTLNPLPAQPKKK